MYMDMVAMCMVMVAMCMVMVAVCMVMVAVCMVMVAVCMVMVAVCMVMVAIVCVCGVQVSSLEGYLGKYKEGLKLAKQKILLLQAERVSYRLLIRIIIDYSDS